MSLIELSLNTTDEAVDWVCTLLAEAIDISDVEIEEYAKPQRSPLISQDAEQPNWKFTIRLYLPYDFHSRTQAEKIVNLLSPLHRTGLTTEVEMTVVDKKSTDADILNPLVHRIGKRFVVLEPDTNYQAQTADEITLRLKKSLAFGSGLHPATILSLQLLERHVVPNMNTLDLGSGSGILSVAMAKLGANVLALDNDTVAVQATQAAVRWNDVEQQVKVMQGSLGSGSELGHWMGGNTVNHVEKIEATQTFDLIVANILARIHAALADDYRRALRHNQNNQTGAGILITSGFTTDHEESVVTALGEVGFKIVDCERQQEWVALAYHLH